MKGTGPKRKVNKYLQVKKYLQRYKKITTWDAITKFRATRLSDIIFRMRSEGYSIASEWHTNKDGIRYTIYYYWGDKDE